MNADNTSPVEPQAISEAADPSDIMIDDVWSRTAPKYRNRAVVLLIANMVLFGALCCFMFWLRTGWYFPPTYEGYIQEFVTALRFSGPQQVTAYDLLTEPISLNQVPFHAVVIGLLIASLAAIPILVAILYRLPAALPFCAMVGALAVMPWLSANLMLACAIAHYARKRLKFRFAAALLALIPIGVYLLASSRKYDVGADLLTTPFEQGLVVVPLLLSIVGACGLMASVLAIAKAVNYRPGAITPLLAFMFLAPMFLFMGTIGRDELHYRFLELYYGPRGKKAFVPMDVNPMIREAAVMAWQFEEDKSNIEELEARFREAWADELEPIGDDNTEQAREQAWLQTCKVFAREQHDVIMACKQFIDGFHNSRYVRCALYIKGRAESMRVDRPLFRREGLLRFYNDYPSELSRDTWLTLVKQFPDSPLTHVARFRLAQLDARRGEVDAALNWLQAIADRESRPVGQTDAQAPEAPAQLFAREEPEDALYEEYKDVPAAAAEFRELLVHNRDPLTGDAPLVRYLQCMPRHESYHQNLSEVVQQFSDRPDMRIRDNIAVELALASPSPVEAARRLKAIQRDWPDGDTQARVLYELGLLYEVSGELTESRQHFDALYEAHPDSRYAGLARRRRFSP